MTSIGVQHGESVYVSIDSSRYRVDRPWGQLLQGVALESPGHVAVDSFGNVYVCQRSNPPVIVFAPNGEYLHSWGAGEISDAHGIFITPDDRVWLVDRDAHQVLCFDSNGSLIQTIGKRHHPRFQEPFNHPAGVAQAPSGDIFVADGYANSCVHRFSPDGVHTHTWGNPGRWPGDFRTPHAVWIDHDGRVLVVDRDNDRVQVFSQEGDYITEWIDFVRPMDIYQDQAGRIYVTDQVPRLSILSPDGELIGRCRPILNSAHSVYGDSSGNIYLAELAPQNRITRLTPADREG